MRIKRTATAHWQGSGKEGKGTLSTQSKLLSGLPYGYKSRFEDGEGTNPEELIAAAHSGCFSMKLAFVLQAAGITAQSIDTTATVVLEEGNVNAVHLQTRVKADGLSPAKLQEAASDAKLNCPISKLLKAEITLNAELAE